MDVFYGKFKNDISLRGFFKREGGFITGEGSRLAVAEQRRTLAPLYAQCAEGIARRRGQFELFLGRLFRSRSGGEEAVGDVASSDAERGGGD